MQRKVVTDLVQLASFAQYLDQVVSAMEGGRGGERNRQVRQEMRALSVKLKVVACSLRPAVTGSLLPHVTPQHVPAGLRLGHRHRHAKHNRVSVWRRVATYVIVEKVEQFLRILPGTYRKNGVKICRASYQN